MMMFLDGRGRGVVAFLDVHRIFFKKTILKTMKIKEATFVHIHYSSVGKNGNEQIFEVFSTNFCMNNAGVNNLEDGVGGRYAQSWTSKEGGLQWIWTLLD